MTVSQNQFSINVPLKWTSPAAVGRRPNSSLRHSEREILPSVRAAHFRGGAS